MDSNAPKRLSQLGQSLWLDNITRDLLDSGTLKRYIDEKFVTGLRRSSTTPFPAASRTTRKFAGN
jgi:transaldolase